MSRLVEYELQDGGTAYAEVTEIPGGVVPVAAPDQNVVLEISLSGFTAALEAATPAEGAN